MQYKTSLTRRFSKSIDSYCQEHWFQYLMVIFLPDFKETFNKMIDLIYSPVSWALENVFENFRIIFPESILFGDVSGSLLNQKEWQYASYNTIGSGG